MRAWVAVACVAWVCSGRARAGEGAMLDEIRLAYEGAGAAAATSAAVGLDTSGRPLAAYIRGLPDAERRTRATRYGSRDPAKAGDELVCYCSAREPRPNGLEQGAFVGDLGAAGERVVVLTAAGGFCMAALLWRPDPDIIGQGECSSGATMGFSTPAGKRASQLAGCAADPRGDSARRYWAFLGGDGATASLLFADGASSKDQTTTWKIDSDAIGGSPPALAVRPDGTVLLAYRRLAESRREVLLRRAASPGFTFHDRALVAREDAEPLPATLSALAVAAVDDRTILIAYEAHPVTAAALRVMRSSDGGASFDGRCEVAPGRAPVLAVTTDGLVALAFEAPDDHVMIAFSSDGGAHFDAPVRLDEGAAGERARCPSLVASRDARAVYAGWIATKGDATRVLVRKAIAR